MIVVNRPKTARCQTCGSTIRQAGHDGWRIVWEDEAFEVECPGLFDDVVRHQPMGEA
jgi:hypothetical protein